MTGLLANGSTADRTTPSAHGRGKVPDVPDVHQWLEQAREPAFVLMKVAAS